MVKTYDIYVINKGNAKHGIPSQGGQSRPWPLTPLPQIDRVPPLINILHVKFESDCSPYRVYNSKVQHYETHTSTHSPVIPRKTEFSKNCLSPIPKPNIEKNVIWIQMFLFLNSDVTLWCVKW